MKLMVKSKYIRRWKVNGQWRYEYPKDITKDLRGVVEGVERIPGVENLKTYYSSKSDSTYVTFKLKGRKFKIRVSDHDLPQGYQDMFGKADFDVQAGGVKREKADGKWQEAISFIHREAEKMSKGLCDMNKSRVIVRKSVNLEGLGDNYDLPKLAEKHKVPIEKINKQFAMGIKVELEHTKDPGVAGQIAVDHLFEDPFYYSKLKKMEKAIPDEHKQHIEDYFKNAKGNIKDSEFHSFVENMGVDPHDAEEYVYELLMKKSNGKVEQVMREFKEGTLTSHGKPVTSRKQAIAIAMSEAGMSKGILVKAKRFVDSTMRQMKVLVNPPAEYDRKYKLQGRVKWNGLDIAIENKKGSYREGVDSDGNPWKTLMKYDYGRIGGSKATDDEGVDVYLGPDLDAKEVYVVHQNNPATGRYDEDKCLCGFPSPEIARAAYLSQYDRPGFYGGMSTFLIEEFKEALKKNKGNCLYRSPLVKARDSFVPPESVANAAKRALEAREKHGDKVKGGTAVGWTRANQLANRENLSLDTIGRMVSFFARHEGNQKVEGDFKWGDAGYTAWMIWGGDAGKSWANSIWKREKKEVKKSRIIVR